MTFHVSTAKKPFMSSQPSPSKRVANVFLTSLADLGASTTRPGGKNPSPPPRFTNFYSTGLPKSALSMNPPGTSSLPDIQSSEALLKEMHKEKERLHRFL
jgi:hypothetical protein